MKRKHLEANFNWKIASELTLFKITMMKKEKEDLIANAYEVANKIEFYEMLVELSQKMTEEQLYACLQVSNLLSVLYDSWMKIPDDAYLEKEQMVWELLEGKTHAA